MPRVVSFLPAGTEIAFAIGAGPSVVGRSHECDYPPAVKFLPVVSRPALRLEELSQEEIDAAVAEQLRHAGTLYEVDEALLRELSPDVILTQDLCQVCAPSGNELTRAVAELPTHPQIVWLTPQTIQDIHANVLAVGRATGRETEAERLVRESRARLKAVRDQTAHRRARRVVFLEWVDPFFSAGHWVPEMITLAGGEDALGAAGEDSRRISWDEIVAARPEIIVVAPCGYGLDRATELARTLPPAAGAAVYAVDANAYFARPGPRVADGVELLACLFHCELCGAPDSSGATRVA
jgi:iron complex transport system substrate-binding protein